MVQVEEKRLAELIKKANKYEWLEKMLVDEWFDEHFFDWLGHKRSVFDEYYKYDNMSDKEIIKDYL